MDPAAVLAWEALQMSLQKSERDMCHPPALVCCRRHGGRGAGLAGGMMVDDYAAGDVDVAGGAADAGVYGGSSWPSRFAAPCL